MIFWIAAALAASPNAASEDAARSVWRDRPYIRPHLNLGYVSVNGTGFAQATGGLEGGVIRRYRKKPHYVWTTRASALGLLGLTDWSYGADLRGGSFIGPDYQIVRLSAGPDLWYNGFGTPRSFGYHLPYSLGVDVPVTALFKLSKPLSITTRAVPGWAFDEDRQGGGVGPFHELTLLGALNIRLEGARFTVGYQRSWNVAGVTEGLVLSAGL